MAEGDGKGEVFEQFMDVSTLRNALVHFEDRAAVCVCRIGEFGSEEFLPVVAVGQMRRADGGERDFACLYAIEGRDDG